MRSFSNVNDSLAGTNCVYAQCVGVNTRTTEVSNFTLLDSLEQINSFVRICLMFVQLKASGENSVCVAAVEPVHPFSGFVCFDLVLSVQVNIILKSWQAVFKECSRLLIRLRLLIFWVNYQFTKYEVNVRSQWQGLLNSGMRR